MRPRGLSNAAAGAIVRDPKAWLLALIGLRAATAIRRRLVRFTMLGAVFAAPAAILAADDFWKNPVSGLFSIGSNWVDGTAPTVGDRTNFVSGTATYNVTFTGDTTNNYLSLYAGNVTFQSDLLNHYEYRLTSGVFVQSELTLGTSQRSLDVDTKQLAVAGHDDNNYTLIGNSLTLQAALVGFASSVGWRWSGPQLSAAMMEKILDVSTAGTPWSQRRGDDLIPHS